MNATSGVVRVGEGRGFVVEGSRGRVIVTGAHCLPSLPLAHPASYGHERTYGSLLGALNAAPTVCAECLFVDPIGDIAVLCSPDEQELSNEAEAFDALVGPATPFRVSDPTVIHGAPLPVSLLALDGRWFNCTARHYGGAYALFNLEKGCRIIGGMSGSPILAADGSAIGVVCCSVNDGSEGSGNPRLAHHMQAGLWRDLLSATTTKEVK